MYSFLLFVYSKFSCSSHWPQTYWVAEDGFDFLCPLTSCLEYWNYKYIPRHSVLWRARNWTEGTLHARQALYHLSPGILLLVDSCDSLGFSKYKIISSIHRIVLFLSNQDAFICYCFQISMGGAQVEDRIKMVMIEALYSWR